ncbi:MAG TPA: hypothetical protein VGS08_01835 [Candidatus Saccharimonadales bacterium]|nr:hypothetical protein [Candidatus Saccharimonadales bacterium]
MRKLLQKKLIIAIATLLVVVCIIWLFIAKNKTTNKVATIPSPSTIAVVEVTSSGFLPSTIAVQPNSEVIWVNEDVMPHLPTADPYPTHASLPALLPPRALGQKETYSFLFTKSGTVHYHDDLNPTMTGTVEIR